MLVHIYITLQPYGLLCVSVVVIYLVEQLLQHFELQQFWHRDLEQLLQNVKLQRFWRMDFFFGAWIASGHWHLSVNTSSFGCHLFWLGEGKELLTELTMIAELSPSE